MALYLLAWCAGETHCRLCMPTFSRRRSAFSSPLHRGCARARNDQRAGRAHSHTLNKHIRHSAHQGLKILLKRGCFTCRCRKSCKLFGWGQLCAAILRKKKEWDPAAPGPSAHQPTGSRPRWAGLCRFFITRCKTLHICYYMTSHTVHSHST